ncbi:radical SAM protein [Candidatus Bathyarchaeota archaeon]|nr:MAG: radical SAM protein [Candidatus Bathyarchaeota archaeon]
MTWKNPPSKVRLSLGSAILLGLAEGRLDAEPTTIYMLTYKRGKCSANCAFCPQSRTSGGRADMLSRIVWPTFQTVDVIPRVAKAFNTGKIARVCIQALNYPSVLEDIWSLVKQLRESSQVPISVSCQPLTKTDMQRLVTAGVNRVGIALDAVTKDLFDCIKGASVGGPYQWDTHLKALAEAVEVFGKNNVSTHLIVGLGETEREFVAMIQKCVDLGVYPALFAFTPVQGTKLANRQAPSIVSYRRMQVAHYLITRGIARYGDMRFEAGRLVSFGIPKTELLRIIRTGEPFKTSGCPGCNRPYYNERPGGPIYNFPRELTDAEIAEIEKVLCV